MLNKVLNKKGTTLIELIISLALISVVLIFMIKMLIDINDTVTNSDFSKQNQVMRAEVTRYIEKDLVRKSLSGVSRSVSNGNITVNFSFKDGSSSVITTNRNTNTFTYKNVDNKTRKWVFSDDCEIADKVTVSYARDSKIYTLIVNIEIYTTNNRNIEGSNNILDDITITHIGDGTISVS